MTRKNSEEEAEQPHEKPWSGRFREETDELVQRYTRSVHFDRRLAPEDLRGSQTHVRMLVRCGVIGKEEGEELLDGLEQVAGEIEEGSFPFRDELEDIHMNVEARLKEKIGETADHLHSGRSRNDQVALDLKLYCLGLAVRWQESLVLSMATWVRRAEEYRDDLYPAWTHLQAAQPMSWGHYLLALVEMLRRDHDRLADYRRRQSVSPLGAGALTGTSLPIDPDFSARQLGFERVFGNSYDVVGDRDMVLELGQIATQLMLHLSRLAEDFIYLASTPVSWVELPDALCTGSSMMPQKKNPDLLELMRGKTASVIGHTQALTTLLKGLPTSYHRDLQQDKEHLFPIADLVSDSLLVLARLAADFEIDRKGSRAGLRRGFLMATELAELLVGKGVPFREAHHRVGGIVKKCVERDIDLSEVSADQWRDWLPEVGAEATRLLQVDSVLDRRRHAGSTGRRSIDRQIEDWKRWLGQS